MPRLTSARYIPTPRRPQPLAQSKIDTLKLLALPNEAAAKKLHISMACYQARIQQMFARFDVYNRIGLLVAVLRAGVITLDDIEVPTLETEDYECLKGRKPQ